MGRVVAAARSVEREPAGLQVRRLEAGQESRWDSYVQNDPEATFFHRSGWKTVLERAFRHEAFFLYAESEGDIQGVLPLGYIRSRLFGKALISTPFCVYGGVASCNVAARNALEKEAEDLALRLGADYLEMRNRTERRPDWLTKTLYVTFRKELAPDPDENMKAIPRRQRAMVRKGIQAGLRSELDGDVGRLFDAYSQSVRNLGTPVFSRKYLETLMDVFGRDCEVLTVTKDGRTISSVLSFYFRDEVLPYYGGGTSEAKELRANDFMYWEVMRRACERGLRIFDYGRSKRGTGSYHFKKNWGFEPEALPYQYRLVKAKEMPNVNPLNPKYRLFVRLWKCLPLPLSRSLGPLISRNLG